MKSIRWFFFCILLLSLVMLSSCPPPGGQSPAVPTEHAPPAPVASPMPTQPPAPPVSMTIRERSIETMQPSLPIGEQMLTPRIVADFDLEVAGGNVDFSSIAGVISDSDDGEHGNLKLLNGPELRMVQSIPLRYLQDGQYELGAGLTLMPGSHRFQIVVESTHDRGDTLQVEIRSVKSNLPELRTVVRWPAVSCGR